MAVAVAVALVGAPRGGLVEAASADEAMDIAPGPRAADYTPPGISICTLTVLGGALRA